MKFQFQRFSFLVSREMKKHQERRKSHICLCFYGATKVFAFVFYIFDSLLVLNFVNVYYFLNWEPLVVLCPQDKFSFWNKVLVLLAPWLKAIIASHTPIVNRSFPITILFEHLSHKKLFSDSFWFWVKPFLQVFMNSGDNSHSKIGFSSPRNTKNKHWDWSYVDVS